MNIKKKIATGVVVVFFATMTAGFIVANNLNLLFLIANGSDQPSNLFYLTTTQIFKKLDKRSCDDIISRLREEEYSYLQDLYIYVLGFAGYSGLKGYIMDPQTQCIEKPDMKSTCIKIINAMGASGDTEYVETLELLLEKDKRKLNLPTKYYISRSLYLLTGKSYKYSDDGTTSRKFIITEDLIKARNLILETKGTIRNPEKTMALEKLFRPPGW